MPDPVIHDTFVLERDYPKTPAAVFAALSEPALKRRWFADSPNHDIQDFTMDFRVGGRENLSYRFTGEAPIKGMILTNDTVFQDIVPDQRVVTTSVMTLGNKRITAALMTFELRATATGTRLTCTHQAVYFEGADGPQMRRGGWEFLLDTLGKTL